MNIKTLSKFYQNKKVLIIGHTGFKGSWLTMCLNNFGSKIYGISIDVPTEPSHYRLLKSKKEAKFLFRKTKYS